jgi:hypothetical protein
MVNVGDTVLVGNVESVVTCKWAGGKHMNYTLADGRNCVDLTDGDIVAGAKEDAELPPVEDRYNSWLQQDSEDTEDHYEE